MDGATSNKHGAVNGAAADAATEYEEGNNGHANPSTAVDISQLAQQGLKGGAVLRTDSARSAGLFFQEKNLKKNFMPTGYGLEP